jgi:hypothetical protein
MLDGNPLIHNAPAITMKFSGAVTTDHSISDMIEPSCEGIKKSDMPSEPPDLPTASSTARILLGGMNQSVEQPPPFVQSWPALPAESNAKSAHGS